MVRADYMAKAKPKHDKDCEHRIEMEIVVDCYNEYERATGWYCYLQDQLQFPFTAMCIAKRLLPSRAGFGCRSAPIRPR